MPSLCRVATATAAAGLLGGPIAAGLMSLDGRLGLRGWQWLFLAEGIPPLLLAVVIYLWLPSGPLAASFLLPDERQRLWQWVRGGGPEGVELSVLAGPLEEAEPGQAGAGAGSPGAGAAEQDAEDAGDKALLLRQATDGGPGNQAVAASAGCGGEGSRLSRQLLLQGLVDWRVCYLGGIMFAGGWP